MVFAFLTGFFGSLHCVGMCAPLMMSMSFKNWQDVFLYQIGRISVYMVWGGLLGFFGRLAYWAGLQQVLSISVGIIILISVFLPHFSFFFTKKWSKYIVKSRHFIVPKIEKNKYLRWFIFGIFNGLLPCGLVYVAAIGASITGFVWEGALYMLVFGLGTLPMTLLISMPNYWQTSFLKKKAKYIIPTLLIITSILLIVRGLNLGIPYLSPKIENDIVNCH
ncbi:MAG: sulfite exporter TauE/SafE family protein [Cytophagales bacterium]|nr:MAG: sulfite exporter TauE/SafE family protein [Cytophagales bacterium]